MTSWQWKPEQCRGCKKNCKISQETSPIRRRFDTVYYGFVQQLERLQLQGLREAMERYLGVSEEKGWMRLNRRKPVHPFTHRLSRIDNTKVQEQQFHQQDTQPNLSKYHQINSLPSLAVNPNCRAFSRCRNQKVVNVKNRSNRYIHDPSRQQERVREDGLVATNPSRLTAQSTFSNRKVNRLENEPGSLQQSEPSPRVSQGGSEIRRFRKIAETTNADRRSSRVKMVVISETPATTSKRRPDTPPTGKPQFPQPLVRIETECSNKLFKLRDLASNYDDASPRPHKLQTRPASMSLRRQFNCNSLIERVKSQRVLDAKLELKKRECLRESEDMNASVTVVILRSSKQPRVSNRTGAFIKEDTTRSIPSATKIKSTFPSGDFSTSQASGKPTNAEAPTSNYLPVREFVLQGDLNCHGTTRPSDQIGRERLVSRSMMEGTCTQKCSPLATAGQTTATLKDALEALESAHRWNEWGARTLQHLAKASKAAVERNHSLLDWSPCLRKRNDRIRFRERPQILLPYDSDVMKTTRQGRVLESREEERAFIRDLLVSSGLTKGDWVDKHFLTAKQHVVSRNLTTLYRRHYEQENSRALRHVEGFSCKGGFRVERKEKKLIDQHILYDFVEELLRHELVLRKCTQLGINLTALIHEQERKGQALVQKVWDNLQICLSPTSGDICTTVQSILQKDLKSQDIDFVCEIVEVIEGVEKMIYENLVQELLEELLTKTICSPR